MNERLTYSLPLLDVMPVFNSVYFLLFSSIQNKKIEFNAFSVKLIAVHTWFQSMRARQLEIYFYIFSFVSCSFLWIFNCKATKRDKVQLNRSYLWIISKSSTKWTKCTFRCFFVNTDIPFHGWFSIVNVVD